MVGLAAIFGWGVWPKQPVASATPTKQIASNPSTQQPAVQEQSPGSGPTEHHTGRALKTEKKPSPPNKGITLGTDSVGYGLIPDGTKIGNGSVLVGPTHAFGNTILNQGGTAIGHGATAGPTSIAVGANARAGLSSPPSGP